MAGIIEIDVHGENVETAVREIRQRINNADVGTYRIRIIHGYHGGTRIRDGIWDEFNYGREPKVKRITMGDNQGQSWYCVNFKTQRGFILQTKFC